MINMTCYYTRLRQYFKEMPFPHFYNKPSNLSSVNLQHGLL